jgi:transposase
MRSPIAPHELLPQGLYLESLSIETGRVSIRVASGASKSRCPVCGLLSSRVHSRYSRTLSDLPWHGLSVELEVRARRFFCDEASCERRIFCERLPEVAARARKTGRLEEALLAIALELGGRAGARLALELGTLAACDTLLRRIKGAPGATHVADRWHLLHNLTLTLEEYLLHKRPVLRKAAAPEASPEEKDDADFASGPIMPNRPRTHDRKIEEAARKRYERLVEQWKNIRRLYLGGADLTHICRQLDISARTASTATRT